MRARSKVQAASRTSRRKYSDDLYENEWIKEYKTAVPQSVAIVPHSEPEPLVSEQWRVLYNRTPPQNYVTVTQAIVVSQSGKSAPVAPSSKMSLDFLVSPTTKSLRGVFASDKARLQMEAHDRPPVHHQRTLELVPAGSTATSSFHVHQEEKSDAASVCESLRPLPISDMPGPADRSESRGFDSGDDDVDRDDDDVFTRDTNPRLPLPMVDPISRFAMLRSAYAKEEKAAAVPAVLPNSLGHRKSSLKAVVKPKSRIVSVTESIDGAFGDDVKSSFGDMSYTPRAVEAVDVMSDRRSYREASGFQSVHSMMDDVLLDLRSISSRSGRY